MIPAVPPPPQNYQTAILLDHNARAVHDTALIRFREFDQNKGWTVAKVTPGDRSGSATIPGASINVDTGEFTTPKRVVVIEKQGKWNTMATAPGVRHQDEGYYSWSEPFSEQKRVTTEEDYYSPFADGGTIVFRYDPTAAGIDQFQSVRVIFPDWATDVPSASAFVESRPHLLENGEQKAPEIAQLRLLLGDKNKFLVVEAFRELADSGHLEANLARDHLTHAEAPLDSIFAYLMLTSRRNDELAKQVEAATYASRDPKKLRSIALGAFSAMLYNEQDTKILARSKTALENVRSRLRELKISPDPNSDLYLILSRAGII